MKAKLARNLLTFGVWYAVAEATRLAAAAGVDIDQFVQASADVVFDTRVDAILARNAVYGRASMEHLAFGDAQPSAPIAPGGYTGYQGSANRYTLEGRGYLGFIGYWMTLPTAAFLHARAARLAVKPVDRLISVVGVMELVVCVNQWYGDMGAFSPITNYTLATCFAAALRVPAAAGAWTEANGSSAPASEEFRRDHLQLVGEKLLQKIEELQLVLGMRPDIYRRDSEIWTKLDPERHPVAEREPPSQRRG
jgi:hypothetical protein